VCSQHQQRKISQKNADRSVQTITGDSGGNREKPYDVDESYEYGDGTVCAVTLRGVLISMAPVCLVEGLSSQDTPEQRQGGIHNEHTQQDRPTPE
jgi:hypothetical protein